MQRFAFTLDCLKSGPQEICECECEFIFFFFSFRVEENEIALFDKPCKYEKISGFDEDCKIQEIDCMQSCIS